MFRKETDTVKLQLHEQYKGFDLYVYELSHMLPFVEARNNGYIQGEKLQELFDRGFDFVDNIQTNEITYEESEENVIGFDHFHLRDDHNKSHKDPNYVMQECKDIVNELLNFLNQ